MLLPAVLLMCVCPVSGRDIDEAEAAFERGRMMVRGKQFRKASAVWDSIARLNVTPDYKAKYLVYNGVLQRDSLRDTVRALDYFRRAEACYPAMMQQKTDAIEIDIVHASRGLAEQAEAARRFDVAIYHYDKIIALIDHMQANIHYASNMTYNDMTVTSVGFKLSKAADYASIGRFDEAEDVFENIEGSIDFLKMSDEGEEVMQGWLLDCLSRMQRVNMYDKEMKDKTKALNEAEQLYRRVQEGLLNENPAAAQGVQSQLPQCMATVGEIFLANDRSEEVVDICRSTIGSLQSGDSVRPLISDLMGRAYLALGNETEARQCWRDVLAVDSGFYKKPGRSQILHIRWGKK